MKIMLNLKILRLYYTHFDPTTSNVMYIAASFFSVRILFCFLPYS